ncbi:MAG: restriction endonuclease [Candidatus Edwardsbacteria bacterium]|nr:restriction endonuclease [Candidatus Edwardsbacteria bacterium]
MSRKIEDLEANALKFWPERISEMERNTSIIPKLIETQDKFISLLNIADAEPFAWKKVLSNSKKLSANLFLKHLMVLSDIGGEKLMRFKTELPKVFDNDTMEFVWNAESYFYKFQTLSGNKTWNNVYLKVDGIGLSTLEPLTTVIEDIVNLILFGGAAIANNIPNDIEEKCNIGTLIGQKKELDTFVRQRYIWVSRITGGATANSLGNLAQKYVVDFLQERLPRWDFSKKQIDKISQNKRTLLSYDIVAKSPKGHICAIEASFQVTTNSTIERKAGQAQARQKQLARYGHKIAYIIDGAGNFERSSALKTICQFSDCIVTFKDSELERLSKFLISLDK